MPLERLFEKAGEAGPGVVGGDGLLGELDELGEGVFEHRVDQLLLGREVAIERPHPEACMPGDLLDRDVDPRGREQLARARDEQLPVAAGVTT